VNRLNFVEDRRVRFHICQECTWTCVLINLNTSQDRLRLARIGKANAQFDASEDPSSSKVGPAPTDEGAGLESSDNILAGDIGAFFGGMRNDLFLKFERDPGLRRHI